MLVIVLVIEVFSVEHEQEHEIRQSSDRPYRL